ncbi:IS66 family insertion sequence element accessory protein TnpA [Fusibacter sp. JL298sf-3]
MKREANKAEWHGLINEQKSSGQTQAQWCAENAINTHNFRYWKSRLNSERDKVPKSSFGFVSLKPSLIVFQLIFHFTQNILHHPTHFKIKLMGCLFSLHTFIYYF